MRFQYSATLILVSCSRCGQYYGVLPSMVTAPGHEHDCGPRLSPSPQTPPEARGTRRT